MRIVAAVKNTLVLLAIVLINSVSFAGHSSAMSTMSHEMSGMNHSSGNATSCATLCRTAVISKEENVINNVESEDDIEPAIPLYAQNNLAQIDAKSASQRLYAFGIKPPPKIPIYIIYGVFRV